jgi:hypothetical protein
LNKLILSLLLLLLFTTSIPAQTFNAAQSLGISGMRVMPVDELSVRADVIVRAKVKKIEKASYLDYTQLATLQVTEIIKGDNRLKEVRVWAGTQNINANDSFPKDGDVLIFLVHEQTFYRLLNFQNGIFTIEGDTVRNWRMPAIAQPTPNNPQNNTSEITDNPGYNIVDKSFVDVRKDIEIAAKSIKGTNRIFGTRDR